MSSRLRQAYVAANLQDVPSPGLRARHSEAAAARSSAFVRALPCFSCTCGNTRIIVSSYMQVLSTYRFTVEEYHRLGEVGILGEDDRVELLDGDLITMAPIGGEHRTLVDSLNLLLANRVEKDRYRIGIQNPISLNSCSEPQPDVVLYDSSVLGRH